MPGNSHVFVSGQVTHVNKFHLITLLGFTHYGCLPLKEPSVYLSNLTAIFYHSTDKKDGASSVGVGELLEITPVSAAIARHLGIDLTPEGKAAMRRRGVSIVVHGAPLSGKWTIGLLTCCSNQSTLNYCHRIFDTIKRNESHMSAMVNFEFSI